MKKLFNKTFSEIYQDFENAQQTANTYIDADDGGTCNLDSVVIDIKGIRNTVIQEFNSNTSFTIGAKLSGMWRGYAFIYFNTHGQASRRTKMMESIHKYLKYAGYPVAVYYQMD